MFLKTPEPSGVLTSPGPTLRRSSDPLLFSQPPSDPFKVELQKRPAPSWATRLTSQQLRPDGAECRWSERRPPLAFNESRSDVNGGFVASQQDFRALTPLRRSETGRGGCWGVRRFTASSLSSFSSPTFRRFFLPQWLQIVFSVVQSSQMQLKY